MKQKPLIHLLLKYGLAKTEQSAAGMLLGLTIINFFFSIYLLHGAPLYAFGTPEDFLNSDILFEY